MADRENLVVNGYSFGSWQDAQEAEAESHKTEYFKEKAAGRKAGNLLALYDKLLDEKVFKTPVGWEYLRQLREEILQSDIPAEQIRPIPLHTSFTYRPKEDIEKTAERLRLGQREAKERRDLRFRISLCVNFLLAVLVAAMFLITLKSDHPNLLNYKNVVTNQYASWEQDLTERENKLREREQELQAASSLAEEKEEIAD